ncbi:MAG: DUF4143 domain-containing protein [Planctomycetota bacterium]
MELIKKRTFWLGKIEQLWKKTNLIWLYGVRRSGKTFLCRSVPEIEYFDCELPRIRQYFSDPEELLKSLHGKKAVIDEIHRLDNPSEVLKIAADYFPNTKIIATGSSTLGTSIKFKDTLAGRKKDLWLLPMNWQDLNDFNRTEITYRLHRGGLPPFFLSKKMPESDFQEWLDAFWSKDIQELFRLERRHSFQKFVELIFMQSGGIFEATKFARPCEVSRTTISNYLKILEATSVAYVLKPFSSYKTSEIIAAPKVYAFDTGFVCYWRGWDKLRKDDMGILWEHFVLNEIYANIQNHNLYYWRDKRGHEIDFILTPRAGNPIAIETKWDSKGFEPTNLMAFRRQHSGVKNFVVSSDVIRPFSRKYHGLIVEFLNLPDFINKNLLGLK